MRTLTLLCFTAHLSIAATWLVPGVVSRGAQSSSSLRILNRGSAPAAVTIELLPLAGTAAPDPVTRDVAPGQTFIAADALGALFNLTNSAGALRITADQPLAIAADVKHSRPVASPLPVWPWHELLQPGDTATSLWLDDSAAIGVVLAVPDSAANIVIRDGTGSVLLRKFVEGDPGVYEFSASALLGSAIFNGRVDFEITRGEAAGYVTVANDATAGAFLSSALPPDDGALPMTLTGVRHVTAPGGAAETTEVRILNRSAVPQTVTIAGLSLAGSASVTVGAGEVKRIPDILGTLFGATSDTSGALQFQSAGDIVVLARTSARAPGGRSLSSFDTALSTGAYTGAGQTSVILGLGDGSATNLLLLSGPHGATADLTVKDSSGRVLATAPNAVNLAASTPRQISLADLFSGVAIPAESLLEISVTSGALDVTAGTPSLGTKIVHAATEHTYVCVPPVITSFTSSPQSLPSPGAAQLYWSVAHADRVTLAPATTPLPFSGSQSVTVNGSTKYTLQATGVCGTVTQDTLVAVGAPGIASVSPSSASPGIQITIQPSNLPDSVAPSSVQFTFADGTVFNTPVDRLNPDGSLAATVPLVKGTKGADLTGPVQIALVLNGQPAGASAAFTVMPLVYTGKDAVADINTLVANRSQQASSTLDQFVATGIATAAQAAAARQFIDSAVAVLKKMTADIAATGSAVVPVDLPSAAYPNPDTVTVTRATLEHIMALIANLAPSVLAPPSNPSLRPAAETLNPRAAGPGCLTDDLVYQSCLAAEALSGQLRAVLNFEFKGGGPWACAAQLAAFAGVVALNFLSYVEAPLRPMCEFQPIFFNGFVPVPRTVALSRTRSSEVQIKARLGPLYGSQGEFAADVALALANVLAAAEVSVAKACGTTALPKLQSDIDKVTQSIREWSAKNLPAKTAGEKQVPVFTCDLIYVLPVERGKVSSQTPRLKFDGTNSDKGVYLFRGLRSGGTSIQIDGKAGHFLYLQEPYKKNEKPTAKRITEDVVRNEAINVGGASRHVAVTHTLSQIALGNGANFTDDNSDSQQIEFDTPLATSRQGVDWGSRAQTVYTARKLSDTAWEITQTFRASNGTRAEAPGTDESQLTWTTVLPQLPDNSQTATVAIQASGSAGTYSDDSGNTYTGDLQMGIGGGIGFSTFNDTRIASQGQTSFTYSKNITASQAVSASAMFDGDVNYSGTVIYRIQLTDSQSQTGIASSGGGPPAAQPEAVPHH